MRVLKISIRTKLFCIIFMVATISLLLSYGLSGWIQYNAFKDEMIEKLQINARLVGEYCVVPLTFGDKTGALEILKKLETIPTTEAAHLYDSEKKLFASYCWKEHLTPPATAPPLNPGTFKQGSLSVVLPVIFQQRQYGTIAIQASDKEFREKTLAIFIRLLEGMAILLALSGLLALWLQKLISAPILHLANITKGISGKRDDTIRLPKTRHDEIGVLYGAYNTMLDSLVQHDRMRDRAEQDLRSSEQRFRSLIESITECFWEVDHELHLTYASPIFEQITGYAPKEVEGLRLDRLPQSDTTSKKTLEHLVAAMRTEEPFKMVEDSFLQKIGKEVHLESSGTPILDVDNKLLGYRGITRDITEQVKLESRLRQAQKMESIGTLAGGIAHDFNNILFPILGHSELLLQENPENSKFRSRLNQIHTSTLRAKDLVRQILTFSRQDTNELRLMKMQPIIKEALKLIRSTIPKTIEIKKDINPSCGIIKADPTQIHQIVMNLSTNAYHAMQDDGGKLTASLKEVEFGKLDTLKPSMSPGAYACLAITDTGTGIPKDVIEKIFEPFFTTKDKSKGTGMGLSVVHGIVKSMNGAIHVYSEPGKGTVANVYLPIVKTAQQQEVLQTKKTLEKGDECILLVDDEETILEMVEMMLTLLGYDVTSYMDSIEALEFFRENPSKFDMVITDMAMPGLPGDKFAGDLLQIRSDIPILLCTGFSEIMSEEKAASYGIKGFLMKPIVMQDLAQKIRELLDSAKGTTQG